MDQKISVILPVYNESRFIGEIFEEVREFSVQNPNFDFIFIDDGSTDSTKMILSELVKGVDRVRLISYSSNNGKGFAVRKGVENSSGEFVCFTDGDLAYSLDYLKVFSKKLLDSDVVIGWRAPFSENLENTKSIRKLAGKVFNFFSRLILELDFPDMQAGIKGFRRGAADYLFSKQKINGWSFDTEIMFLAKRRNYFISQVPVKVSDSNLKIKSQVHLFRDSLKMFGSLLKIRFNYFLGKYG